MRAGAAEKRCRAAAWLIAALAGCKGLEPGEVAGGGAPIDVQHYALAFELWPETRSFTGTCVVTLAVEAEELTKVRLDLEGLEVQEVIDAAGRRLPFEHGGGVLTARLGWIAARGEVIELEVRYGGVPAKGLWFAGGEGEGATHVFTQGECEDARWWFPCHDVPSDRASSEIEVAMPIDWVSIAAGERVRDDVVEGRKVEGWKMDFPHPPYLVTLTAGKFVVQEGEWDGVPLLFAAEPAVAELLRPSLAETDEVLACFSELTGVRYPYAKYAQVAVENFPFGGMENISATTLTDRALVSPLGARDGGATGLVAHEAAHQWFGDLLTCADWSHVWLNEGFATYLSLLYTEAAKGLDEFRARMADVRSGYLAADVGEGRRPTVWGECRDPLDLFFGGQAYAGGACRLHYLRFVLGERAFVDGLRTYVAENAGRSVVTADFRRALEKIAGRDLAWFFEQWFERAGYPELEVRWEHDALARELRLEVEQVQAVERGTPAEFRLPAEVEIGWGSGARREALVVDQRRQSFVLPCDEPPQWVLFDPSGWIPARIEQERSGDEWSALLGHPTEVNVRRAAARELGRLAATASEPETAEAYVVALVERLTGDASADVRAAAAEGLGASRSAEGRERLVAAAGSAESAAVRAAALRALAAFAPDAELAQLGRAAFDERYSLAAMGAAAALVRAADPEGAVAWFASELERESFRDEVREVLLGELVAVDSEPLADMLLRWATDERTDAPVRAVAARGLGRHGQGDAAVRAALGEMLAQRDYKLRAAAIAALGELRDERALALLGRHYRTSVDPRERRAIEAAFRSMGATLP